MDDNNYRILEIGVTEQDKAYVAKTKNWKRNRSVNKILKWHLYTAFKMPHKPFSIMH